MAAKKEKGSYKFTVEFEFKCNSTKFEDVMDLWKDLRERINGYGSVTKAQVELPSKNNIIELDQY